MSHTELIVRCIALALVPIATLLGIWIYVHIKGKNNNDIQ